MATEAELKLLLEAAHKVKGNSYCPYSKVQVGAAVMTECGKILAGANVECASYGLGVCAERGLLTHAASQGYRKFKTIVVVSNLPEITPCGACRQFIVEFGSDIEVYTDCPVDGTGKPRKFGILELLPGAFTPRSLGISET